ncbi:hypothetical protein ACFY30_30450 [Streptomyces sp. NPDC000345]|uniref:hypothetical protein n=1 Tax=Streptomyces sp. NPDC000345 TaxID=3364537 RepID=UPI0036823EC8
MRASRAAAVAISARARPVAMRAATSREGASPARTKRRSAARAARIWKYMAIAAMNPAAQPAVAVCTAGPPGPPSSSAASASGRAATTTNTTGTRMSTSRFTGVRAASARKLRVNNRVVISARPVRRAVR